jgi:LruC domain-containing protein
MRKIYQYGFMMAIILLVASCRKTDLLDGANKEYANVENLDDMVTPPNFNYSTIRDVNFEIQLYTPGGQPLSGVPVQISKVVSGNLVSLITLITDRNGFVQGVYALPTSITEVVVSPNYVGVPNNIVVPVAGDRVTFRLTKDGIPENTSLTGFTPNEVKNRMMKKTSTNYKYLAKYNSSGVPANLLKRDTISKSMLDFVNNSLPENKSVPKYHPTYLGNSCNTDLDITEKADVWITFVHEGAGYTNALCYYKYNTKNPPTTVKDIDTFYVVFPNASYAGNGGGLYSGDKVKIGTFDAGVSIGFVCISNGWNGSAVDDGLSQLFSDKNLNDVSNSELKQHTVLLYDDVNKQFYIGCEDIKRDNSSCDNDFNDIVFYAKSNPVKAISSQNVSLADNGVDTDKDGVSDLFDAFPKDASLAYKNIFPEPDKFGTLAFEDSWPGKGDYDFNDLVVGYQYEQWCDATNKVKEMKCRLVVRAIGAHYYHGFGFQLNVGSSEVSWVKGSKIYDDYIKLSNNQTENSQNTATIIAFDNDYKLVNRPSGSMLNTEEGSAFQKPDTLDIQIVFGKPQTASALGTAPFNPFIFIDGDRGKEVHLPGYAPTTLVNKKYFGTYHDNTNGKDVFYKTLNNLPYAINIPETLEYPLERQSIHYGYLKFAYWAQSGGTIFTDWYKDIEGYRKAGYLYSK